MKRALALLLIACACLCTACHDTSTYIPWPTELLPEGLPAYASKVGGVSEIEGGYALSLTTMSNLLEDYKEQLEEAGYAVEPGYGNPTVARKGDVEVQIETYGMNFSMWVSITVTTKSASELSGEDGKDPRTPDPGASPASTQDGAQTPGLPSAERLYPYPDPGGNAFGLVDRSGRLHYDFLFASVEPIPRWERWGDDPMSEGPSWLWVISRDASEQFILRGSEIVYTSGSDGPGIVPLITDGEVILVEAAESDSFMGPYGLISAEGKTLLEPAYALGLLLGNGYAAFEKDDDTWTICDAGGSITELAAFDILDLSEEGVLLVIDGDGMYRYLNLDGTAYIDAIFDDALPFQDGRAVVTVGEKYGVIDESGLFLLEPKYEFLTSFWQGIALYTRDGKRGVLSDAFVEVTKPIYEDYLSPVHDGKVLVAIRPDGTFDLISSDSIVSLSKGVEIDLEYSPYVGELFVAKEGGWGLIDMRGEWVVSPDYNVITVSEFGNRGIALAEDGMGIHILNRDGREMFNRVFQDVRAFDEHVVLIENGIGRWLLLDMDAGEEIRLIQ